MRVGVFGAGGRMGREVCKAISGESDIDLACVIDPAFAGSTLDEIIPGLSRKLVVQGSREMIVKKDAEAMVDFTVASSARENVLYALQNNIHCVVGTTGLTTDDLDGFDTAARSGGVGCLVAPNFAIGAVLMMDFARRAARFMPSCEIIELHHPAKIDAPSGTARRTAHMILEAQGKGDGEVTEENARGFDVGGILIHSVRLPGMVAHQEVIFGGLGQTLTIRHDSTDRESFMTGVIIGLRKVAEIEGLLVGLDRAMGI
ncbi:MAG: 4-hydroxy-tetrahydrodipicolinate reductase [Actinomycetota bacterium]|nr:4-hydroxy-tetrahydrodipicolinate reductase [Actinomycetota bacterium]